MNKHFIRFVFAVLAATVCMCFIFNTSARVANRTIWTAELKPETGIVSNFLSADGESIRVSNYKPSYTFSISVYGGFAGDAKTGTVSVESDGTLAASLEYNEFYLESGKTATFDLILTPVTADQAAGTASVRVVCGDTALAGSFTVPLNPDEEYNDTIGRLAYCPKWYNKNTPIMIKVGSSDVELQYNGDVFPEMTVYKVNGIETVLYDGGTIFAPANSVLEIDLSRTSVDGEYLMINTATQILNLKNTSVPSVNNNGEAVSMTAQKAEIPVLYEWEKMEPVITFEKLETDKNGNMSWTEAPGFSAKASENGYTELDRGASLPGTYRVRTVWKDGDIEVYSLEYSVFVRYE
ncbi:MAG: hypothetical protein IJT91_05875 [Clostridia bacterium]|nr:hypothetical protein [Clostridia bacterium]